MSDASGVRSLPSPEDARDDKAVTLDQLAREIQAWQAATFPWASPGSVAAHLMREAAEHVKDPNDPSEVADLFFLVVGAAAIGNHDLAKIVADKLIVNRGRKWGMPDAEGVVEHVHAASAPPPNEWRDPPAAPPQFNNAEAAAWQSGWSEGWTALRASGGPPASPAAGDAEALAQRFHETYERLAPSFGYETRKESAKPWCDVPEQNRRLMIAVCAEISSVSSALALRRKSAVTQARRALRSLYLAVEESVALDVTTKVEAAFAALRAGSPAGAPPPEGV